MRRRHFLSRIAATGAGASVLAKTSNAAPSSTTGKGVRLPRRLIHIVSDGMSLGTLSCSDQFSRLLRGRGLSWMSLYSRPESATGLVDMRSLNSLVTDSSAASSSWGSGSRIVNGTVNVLPDGRPLKTLFDVLGDAGWARGLVTTTEITHATPAGFGASGLKRDAADPIAEQYLSRNIEVLLGGGSQFFDPTKRKDKKDLKGEFRTAGYQLIRTPADLEQAPLDSRWLGTFASGHLPFSIDWKHDKKLQATVPSLAAMCGAALRKLDRESRFILQVEGGRVDHACHNCDAPSAFHEQVALDEAIDVCLEYQSRQPETLIVMTTDHGNGNPGLNGTGDQYGDSVKLFKNLLKARSSYGVLHERIKNALSPADIRAEVEACCGYKMSLERSYQYFQFLYAQGSTLYGTMNSASAQFGQLMGNYYGVGWTSGAHTSDYVTLVAVGPGAEKFRGFIQNTDIFRKYLELAEIDFQNPSVPLLASDEPQLGAAESASDWV